MGDLTVWLITKIIRIMCITNCQFQLNGGNETVYFLRVSFLEGSEIELIPSSDSQ